MLAFHEWKQMMIKKHAPTLYPKLWYYQHYGIYVKCYRMANENSAD